MSTIFITPPVAKREMQCSASREGAALAVSCANVGSAYAQIREITLLREQSQLARFEGGSYILPGARKSIGLATAQPVAAGEATLKVIRKALANEPSIDWLLENQDSVTHYFHQLGLDGGDDAGAVRRRHTQAGAARRGHRPVQFGMAGAQDEQGLVGSPHSS